MILDHRDREDREGGVSERAGFGISCSDEAHLMSVLRCTIYSDKVMAVLREYGANARDAHHDPRCQDRAQVPIRVQVPTLGEPTLEVQDRGPGLSHDEVFRVFTQYGASTKRGSNEVVGYLGIGCLIAGQPIVTSTGMKPIDKIEVGDLVLTHRGRFKPVYEVMTRKHVGKACVVHISQGSRPLVLTPEHPILISDYLGNVRWEKPCNIVGGYRSQKKGIGAWNTYVVLPAHAAEGVGVLDVSTVLGPMYEWVSGVCTRTKKFEFQRRGRRRITEVENTNERHTITTSRVTSYPGFPKEVPLTEELGWLLGLYAAEGSGKKQVSICLNITEVDFANRFMTGMKRIFNLNFEEYVRPEKNIRELVEHSVPGAALLSALCGSGAAKRVPEIVLLGTDAVRRGFLRGVLDGDGSGTRSRFVFGVASPDLAWGVRTLMHLTECKWGTVGYMSEHKRWSVSYRDAKWSYCMQRGDYILRPVLMVETIDLNTDVFNCSVKEDESYVSDFVLHNSKSGFAYSDSFTVVSRHGGRRRTYAAVLDASERGEMRLLCDEPQEDGETGLTVQVGVRPGDVAEFQRKAAECFRFYQPRPTINLALPEVPEGDAVAVGEGTAWAAVMGGVPYAVDLSQLDVPDYVGEVGGVARFAIGDLRVSASREGLRYDDRTKTALVEKLVAVCEQHVRQLVRGTAGLSPWERRLRFAGMEVFAPLLSDSCGVSRLFDAAVKLGKPEAERLRLCKFKSVPVSPKTRLVYVDDARGIRGYGLGEHDLVVRRGTAATHGESLAVLRRLVADAGLDGVPVVQTSSLPWERPASTGSRGGRSVKGAAFVFRADHEPQGNGRALSDRWTAVEREPADDDVYVLLDRFQTPFYDAWASDARIMRALGVELPTVYGYRVVAGADNAHPGRTYEEWAHGLYDLAVAACPTVEALVHALPYRNVSCHESAVQAVVAALGAAHPVAALAARVMDAHELVERSDRRLHRAAMLLAGRMERGDARPDIDAVKDQYPLLRENFRHLLQGDPRHWCDYIAAMDHARADNLQSGQRKGGVG